MHRSALFSPCGVYRYLLSRRWSRGGRVVWVMLNPSTADETRDDPTIRRCIGFSRAWGFGAMDVVNLYALRATEPAVVRRHAEPVGPENDVHIAAAVRQARAVVAAWGAFGFAKERVERVMRLMGERVECLGVTRGGWPRHPLYARGDSARVAWPGVPIIRSYG